MDGSQPPRDEASVGATSTLWDGRVRAGQVHPFPGGLSCPDKISRNSQGGGTQAARAVWDIATWHQRVTKPQGRSVTLRCRGRAIRAGGASVLPHHDCDHAGGSVSRCAAGLRWVRNRGWGGQRVPPVSINVPRWSLMSPFRVSCSLRMRAAGRAPPAGQPRGGR